MGTFIERTRLGPDLAIINGKRSFYRRFNRVWPRVWVDGVLCYNKQFNFFKEDWPHSDGDTVQWWLDEDPSRARWLNIMGINKEDLISPKYSDGEVEKAYFTLSQPANETTGIVTCNMVQSFITGIPENTVTNEPAIPGSHPAIDVAFNVKINYGGNLKNYLTLDNRFAVPTTYDSAGNEETTYVVRSATNQEILAQLLTYPELYFVATNQNRYYKFVTEDVYQDYQKISGTTLKKDDNKAFSRKLYAPVATYAINKKGSVYDDGTGDPEVHNPSPFGGFAIFDPDQSIFSRSLGVIIPNKDDMGFSVNITYKMKSMITGCSSPVTKYLATFNVGRGQPGSGYGPCNDNYALKVFNTKTYSVLDKTMNGILQHFYPYEDVYICHTEKFKPYNRYPVLLWHEGYMTVEGAAKMSILNFSTEMTNGFGMDQDIEDPEAWETVLAVVIIIVAIVLVIWSAGTLLAGASGAVAVAGGLLAAAGIVLSLGGFILAKYGGASSAGYVKIIGGMAQVVGWLGTILGIYAIISSFASAVTAELTKELGEEVMKDLVLDATNKAALEAAKEAAVRAALESGKIGAMQVVKAALSVVGKAIIGSLGLAGKSAMQIISTVTTWADNAFTVYKYYDENYGEMAKINQLEKELQSEYDKMNEMNEKNAPSRMDLAFGETYQTSFGSFDAIEELNKKIEFGIGGNKELMDPHERLI